MPSLDSLKAIVAQVHAAHPSMAGRTYALCAGMCNALLAIFMKFVSKGVPFTATVGVQSAMAVLALTSVYGSLGESPFPANRALDLALFLRGLLGSFLFMGFNLGLKLLPAPKFMVLNNTTSIWVVLLAPFFLKEYPNRTILAMVLLSFLGIVLLVDPSLLLPAAALPDSARAAPADTAPPLYYYLLPLSTGLGGAGVGIFLKAYAGRITAYQNAFYFLAFCAFYGGLFRIALPSQYSGATPTGKDLVLMGLTGVCGVSFQIFLSLATKFEHRASIVSVLLNSQIVFTYVLDFLVLGNPVDAVNCIGGAVVIFCAVVITFSKEAASSQKAQADSQTRPEDSQARELQENKQLALEVPPL